MNYILCEMVDTIDKTTLNSCIVPMLLCLVFVREHTHTHALAQARARDVILIRLFTFMSTLVVAETRVVNAL